MLRKDEQIIIAFTVTFTNIREATYMSKPATVTVFSSIPSRKY